MKKKKEKFSCVVDIGKINAENMNFDDCTSVNFVDSSREDSISDLIPSHLEDIFIIKDLADKLKIVDDIISFDKRKRELIATLGDFRSSSELRHFTKFVLDNKDLIHKSLMSLIYDPDIDEDTTISTTNALNIFNSLMEQYSHKLEPLETPSIQPPLETSPDILEFENFMDMLRGKKERGVTLVYYAHAIRKYGTMHEKIEIMALKKFFSGIDYYIVNPNPTDSDFPLLDFDFKKKDEFEKKMVLFKRVIDMCSIFSFSEISYRGGEKYIGKGVYIELMHAISKKIPILLIREDLLRFESHLSSDEPFSYDSLYNFFAINPANIEISVDEINFAFYSKILETDLLFPAKHSSSIIERVSIEINTYRKTSDEEILYAVENRWGKDWILWVSRFGKEIKVNAIRRTYDIYGPTHNDHLNLLSFLKEDVDELVKYIESKPLDLKRKKCMDIFLITKYIIEIAQKIVSDTEDDEIIDKYEDFLSFLTNIHNYINSECSRLGYL